LGKKNLNSLMRIRDPESFFTLDPGWKNSDPGSWINIPDPQQKLYCQVNRILWQCFGPGTGD
jgi:hypothetical protein